MFALLVAVAVAAVVIPAVVRLLELLVAQDRPRSPQGGGTSTLLSRPLRSRYPA